MDHVNPELGTGNAEEERRTRNSVQAPPFDPPNCCYCLDERRVLNRVRVAGLVFDRLVVDPSEGAPAKAPGAVANVNVPEMGLPVALLNTVPLKFPPVSFAKTLLVEIGKRLLDCTKRRPRYASCVQE